MSEMIGEVEYGGQGKITVREDPVMCLIPSVDEKRRALPPGSSGFGL